MQKNISHLGMLVCLGSMLTGCGIYTKYQQPEVQTEDCLERSRRRWIPPPRWGI